MPNPAWIPPDFAARAPRPASDPPAHRAIRLDLTPDELTLRIGSFDRPALLESAGPQFGEAGRYSILAARPRRVIETIGPDWTLRDDSGPPLMVRSPGLGPLRDAFAPVESRPRPDTPGPFAGGWIGFLGYDLAPRLERLPRRTPADSRIPDARFGLYDTFALVDWLSGRADLIAVDVLDEGEDELDRRVREWKRDLERVVAEPPRSRLTRGAGDLKRLDYRARVRRAIDYIEAGDIFQVNLSQRFRARGEPVALDLHRRLKRISPAPHAAFLAWDDLAIVSASPELFYKVEDRRIETRPIKGTRRRARDPVEDERLRAELRASLKDRAELTMIVDLERNDLGRVSTYGSIHVSDPLAVESFAQVHHLVATVGGALRPGVDAVDVIAAVFPGGSITGAPKIRAMEIIDELEPNRRGPYTGAIGYVGLGESTQFNIAIRTLLVEGDRVSYQVGGGIVADSLPVAEYQETLHKGAGLRRLIEESDRWG